MGQEASVQINGLEAGQAYRFQVRGKNEFGEGPWSHWSAAYTVPEPVREPRKDVISRALEGQAVPLQPRTHSDSSTSVVLQWEEPCSHGAQILGYRVQYGPDPDDPSTLQTTSVMDGSASVTVHDLAPNHKYHFRVCAINQAGDSAWSAWTDAVGMKAVVPGRVSPPRGVQALSRELVVEWDEPAACGFQVLRYDVRIAREDETMTNSTLLSGTGLEAGERRLHVRDLEPNTAYYFQVRSETAVGPSDWSDASEPLKTLPEVPERCCDLRAASNAVGALTLEWTAPESFHLPITGFLVRWYGQEVKYVEAGRLQVEADPGVQKGDACSARIPHGTPGARLCFEVAAMSQAGLGPFSGRSAEVEATPGLPGRPEAPSCCSRTSGSLLVTVVDTTEDNGSPITGYELRYASSRDMREAITCRGSMKLTRPASDGLSRLFEYPVTGLHGRRGPYYFSVRAVSDAGKSDWSMPSIAQMLRGEAPSRMSAPELSKAESDTALLISYMPPAELGARHGGGLLEYELRYARWPGELSQNGSSKDLQPINWEAEGVWIPRWWAPAAPPHGRPPPVRVDGLLSGRKYVFQIRVYAESGIALWSDESAPFATLPSVPDRPKPIVKAPGLDSPFTVQLRLALPQANGSAITDCRLRLLALSAGSPQGWQDFATVWAGQCQVSKVPREREEGADLMEPWQHFWDYTILDFEPGAQYRFMFACTNGVGESAWSDPSEPIVTSPHMPAKCTPPVLAEGGQGNSSLALHWEPPATNGAEIVHYTLQWAGDARFQGYKVIDQIPAPSYTLDGLQPNRRYFFKVAATNCVGQGRFSDFDAHAKVGCFYTLARAPGPPFGLQVQAVERVPGTVFLSWERPKDDGGSNITGYRVSFSRTGAFDDACHLQQKAIRECKLVDLRPATLYYFRVAAINETGSGPATDPVAGQTNPVPPTIYIPPRRPDPPTLKLVKGGKELSVMWTCPERIDKQTGFMYDEASQTHPIQTYRVQLIGCYPDVDAVDHFVESGEVPQLRDPRSRPKENTMTVGDLRGWRYYRAFVQAFSEAGASGWSLPSAVVRSPANVPDAVMDLELIRATPSTLLFEWSCPPGNGEAVTHFLLGWSEHEVLRGWNGGSPAAPPEMEDEGSAEPESASIEGGSGHKRLALHECEHETGRFRCEIESLQPASHYLARIRALSVVGPSAEARLGPLRTASAPPGPPGVAFGTGSTQTSVSFSWRAPAYLGGESVLGYEVRWVVLHAGGPAPAELSDILDGEVLWAHLRPGGRPLPAALQARVEGCRCAGSVQLGSQQAHCVEGLSTGDMLLPIVRARNAAGLGPWSRVPREGLQVQALSTLPAKPVAMSVAPRLERARGLDHRPYALTARWTCPDAAGRPVRRFTLRLQQVEAPQGAQDDPLAGMGHVHEVQVEHPGGEEWREGEELSLQGAHANLMPGAYYVLQVRAVSELGEADDWGVASTPVLTPPDTPLQPAAPTCPWQWPQALQVAWADPWTRGAQLQSCRLIYSMSSTMEDAVELSAEVAHERFQERCVKVDNLGVAVGYHFKVCVKNAVGWSPWSPVSERFVTRACRPAPPDTLRVESLDWHNMCVSWVPPADHGAPIEEYEVVLVDQERVRELSGVLERANKCESEEERDAILRSTTLKECRRLKLGDLRQPAAPDYLFTGLMGNVDYAVSVRAFNAIGSSDWSCVLDGIRTPPDIPARCPLPLLLKALPAALHCEFRLPFDNGSRIEAMELTWERISGPLDRHIALGGRGAIRPRNTSGVLLTELPAPGPEPAPPYGVGGPASALIQDLEAGAYYDVKVRARNAVGWGEASPVVRMLCAPGRPDAPEGLQHTNHTQAEATAALPCSQVDLRPGAASAPRVVSASGGASPRGSPSSPRVVDFHATSRLTRSEVVSVGDILERDGAWSDNLGR